MMAAIAVARKAKRPSACGCRDPRPAPRYVAGAQRLVRRRAKLAQRGGSRALAQLHARAPTRPAGRVFGGASQLPHLLAMGVPGCAVALVMPGIQGVPCGVASG